MKHAENESFTKRIFGLLVVVSATGAIRENSLAAEMKVPVKFDGGHEIGKEDFGRPVVLIAAALGVKPAVFRKSFSGVTPARGRKPTGDRGTRKGSDERRDF